MKVKIITNPSTDFFLDLVSKSQEQLLASPFVKTNVAQMILSNKPKGAKIFLLTKFKLTNFYRNSSDLSALRLFVEERIDVRNYPSLHAKLYIFDSEEAVVTSANLTSGGLQNNYECGVMISDSDTVSALRSEFLNIFQDADKALKVTEEILATAEAIIAKVPKERKNKFEMTEKDIFQTTREDDLYDGGVATIASTLSGWQLDVFKIISEFTDEIFRLEQVYGYKQRLQKLHPKNRNIEAKIRQQLQYLRELGLVEFLGKGRYRKLWKDV